MKQLLSSIYIIMCAVVATSCSDDSDIYIPPYITDFVTATTDGNAMIEKVEFDDGTFYNFAEPKIKAEKADTAYRCIATFTKEGKAYTFYSISTVFAAKPLPADTFKAAQCSPVKLRSIWQSKRYINIALGVLTTHNKPHSFAFCIDSVSGNTQYISLLHKRPEGDDESFTSKIYLSMPLYNEYEKVVFSLNTYEGRKEHSFTY